MSITTEQSKKPRTRRLTDIELAELRALDGARSLAIDAANNATRYCGARLISMLSNHGVDVIAEKSEWRPDLETGVVVEWTGLPNDVASTVTQPESTNSSQAS